MKERTKNLLVADNQILRLKLQSWLEKEGYSTEIKAEMFEINNEKRIHLSFHDITKYTEMQNSLKESKDKYRLLAENIPYVSWISHSIGNAVYVGSNSMHVFGYTPEEIIENGKAYWLNRIHQNDLSRVQTAFEMLFEKNQPYDVEFRYRKKNGTWIWVHEQSNNTYIKDGIFYANGLASDITEQKKKEKLIIEANRKLEKLVYYDPLTGTISRKPLIDLIKKNIVRAKRENKKLALLFLDFEKFKLINDIYGHEIGDNVLMKAAKIIKKNIRKSDLIGRFGGDEFVLCLTNIESVSGATRVAQKINESFLDKIRIKNLMLDLGVSIGISVYPDDGETASDLLGNSDLAMYRAKKHRKNSFHVYNEELHEELIFEQSLKYALEKDEFKINYQAIVDKNQEPYFIEALLRWESPRFGKVMPSAFIPLLEKNRDIIDVGEWLFREACKKQIMINNINQQKILVSINISQYQIEDEFFVRKIDNIIRETNINPKNILLEITEKIHIKNTEKVKKVMAELKEIGIGLIALDDFGSGYSSFSNLIRFSLDIVKIDNFFVEKLDNEKYRNMTLNLINLIKNYGLKVIAEGIETNDQFDCLVEMGCDYFQGYLFSKPTPDIYNVLKSKN